MSQTQIRQFLDGLKTKTFPINSAREAFGILAPRMEDEEKVEALGLIVEQEEEISKRKKWKPDLRDVLKEGWLKNYLIYTKVNEAPDSFHLFSAMAVLGHMMGRRAVMENGLVRLYAPLSFFLLSPAGQGRRSTAIRTATEIGREANGTILKDRLTPEGLLDWLRNYNETLVVADEAATLLNKVEYMQQMPQILCTLMDCPEEFTMKLKQEYIKITRPTVNVILGCAPDWFETTLPKSAVGGGLMSRMITVWEEKKKASIPFPSDIVGQEQQDSMRGALVRKLVDISENGRGRYHYTDKAKETFEEFYRWNDEQLEQAGDKMAAFISRRADHVHRISMVLNCSMERGLEIQEDVLEIALELLRYLDPGIREAYRSAGVERPGQIQSKIMAVIRKKGGEASKSDILKSLSGNASKREIDEAIRWLIEEDAIEWKQLPSSSGNWRYTYQLRK